LRSSDAVRVDSIRPDINLVLDICKELAAPRMVFCTSDGGRNQFSGVLIRDDDRYFVATATHCLNSVKDGTSLTIATWSKSRAPASKLPGFQSLSIVANQAPNADTDIALLQIPERVARDCDADFLTREHLAPGLPVTGLPVLLFGFPSAWQVAQEGLVTPNPLVLIANVIESPHECLLSDPIEPDVDFFVAYGETMLLEGITPVKSPNLQGVSGGAVFAIPLPRSKPLIWSASDMLLAGIQSSAYAHKFARAKSSSYLGLLLDEAKRRS
jgi:hypothetical protein